MRKFYFLAIVFTSLFSHGGYQMPPSTSTYGHVPVISDEMMQKCVIIYNQTQWLLSELNSSYVNQYSSYEVNQYNAKLARYNEMIDWYNLNCAGKQSRSACEATKELNKKNGLDYQECY